MKYLVAILFLLTGLITEAQQRIVIENLAAVDSAWISGGNLFYRKNGNTFNAGSVGGAAPVTSVFGRTGVITAQSGDYSEFYQPLNLKLTTFSALANGTGWLYNNGSGTYSWSNPFPSDSSLSINNRILAGTYTAGNGLTLSGSQFKLGGNLDEDTYVNAGNNYLQLSAIGGGSIDVGYSNGNNKKFIGLSNVSVSITAQNTNINPNYFSRIEMWEDSILLSPYQGKINIDSLASIHVDTINWKPTVWNEATGQFRKMNGWPSGSGSGFTSDTSLSINNRILERLRLSDTAGMLSPYLRKIDTTGKYIGIGWLSSLVTRTELLDSLGNFTELQIDKTLDSLAWQRNDSTLKIKSLGLTAGSSKVTVTPTRTDSTLSYAVDVNEANLTINSIGGTLDNTKLTTNPLSRSNHTGTQTASTISDFAATTRTSISLTTTGTSGAATYNSSTGVLNIPQYTSSGAVDGGGFPSFEAEFHNVNAVQSQFIGLAIASGTNSTAAGATITTNDHPGVVLIRSSTSANSGYGYLTSSTSNNAQMTMKGGEQFDLVFRTPAAFTNTTVRMGYPNTSSSTLPLDGVWMEYVGNGNVVGRTGNSSSYSTTATIATLSANTWYHGRVELSNDRGTATFSLWAENGTSLGSLTLTTNIPATDRQVRIGVVATNSGTSATDLLFVDFMRHKNNQKLNRGNF